MSSTANTDRVGANTVPDVETSHCKDIPPAGLEREAASISGDAEIRATRTAFVDADAGALDPEQIENLRDMFGADAFAKLLSKFDSDLRRRLETIKQGPTRAEILSTAHAMISSAGSMGFVIFSDLCREIERAASDEGELEPSLVAFASGAERVLQTIESLTGSAET